MEYPVLCGTDSYSLMQTIALYSGSLPGMALTHSLVRQVSYRGTWLCVLLVNTMSKALFYGTPRPGRRHYAHDCADQMRGQYLSKDISQSGNLQGGQSHIKICDSQGGRKYADRTTTLYQALLQHSLTESYT